MRWHNEIRVARASGGLESYPHRRRRREEPDGGTNAPHIGTPDDIVPNHKNMIDVSGAFGTIIAFSAAGPIRKLPAALGTCVARYVVPEING